MWAIATAVLMAGLASCSDASSPSDDPSDWDSQIEPGKTYRPVLGEPRWLIPSRELPPEVSPQLGSNNNVDVALHGGRLWLAWRTAPTHFAGPDVRMHLVSSGDLGATWRHEHTYFLMTDLREPHFLSMNGTLYFHFFEAGADMFDFAPKNMWRAESTDLSHPETWGAGRGSGRQAVVDGHRNAVAVVDAAAQSAASGRSYLSTAWLSCGPGPASATNDFDLFLTKLSDGRHLALARSAHHERPRRPALPPRPPRSHHPLPA